MSPCREAPKPRVFNGAADFGFNFTCEMTAKNKAVIKGEITYHDTGTSIVGGSDFPGLRLHGVVDPMIFDRPPTCEHGGPDASWMRPSSTATTGPRTRGCCPRRPADSPSCLRPG